VDNPVEERPRPARYSAELVARWFAAWAEAEDAEVSNLKLLYYAQGHHLAERGAPLFDDEIQAWSHGPVVQDVYHRLKHCGSDDVVLPDSDDFPWDQVDDDTGRSSSGSGTAMGRSPHGSCGT
jgi:uncharacterized phage-associated protein